MLRLVQAHRGTEVWVFGSVARDEDDAESDLDLLVRFEDGASLFDLVGLEQDLEALLGVPVDVVSIGGLRPSHDAILREAVRVG